MTHSGTFVFCAFASVLLCACSLKEDRWKCPCCITITVSEVLSGPRNSFLEYNLTDGGGNSVSFLKNVAKEKDTLVTNVGRGELDLVVISSSAQYSGAEMLIPFGNQSSVLYAAHETHFCSGEDDSLRVTLFKQFAYIDLTITGAADSIPESLIAVRGNVCGWTKKDLAPIEGLFYREERIDESHRTLFMIPRQADNSLELLFLGENDGAVLSKCKIGEEISNRGYDWSARSLKDIRMSLQYSETEFHIVSCEWIDGPVMEVGI